MTAVTMGPRRRGERGTATLWVLGLCVAVLFLGGVALDLWRAVAVRRDLSAMADAAATAGANGLDEAALRAGQLRLDPVRAEAFARDVLARDARAAGLEAARVEVTDVRVAVTVEDDVAFTLLRLFTEGEPVRVRATAAAEPRVRP